MSLITNEKEEKRGNWGGKLLEDIVPASALEQTSVSKRVALKHMHSLKQSFNWN